MTIRHLLLFLILLSACTSVAKQKTIEIHDIEQFTILLYPSGEQLQVAYEKRTGKTKRVKGFWCPKSRTLHAVEGNLCNIGHEMMHVIGKSHNFANTFLIKDFYENED